MEEGQLKERWAAVEDRLRSQFGKTPNLEAILFLIGIQESGQLRKKFTKEQKQDLMHVAVCSLLARAGYYRLDSHDEEGWPHFTTLKPVPPLNMQDQEDFLKSHIIAYFLDDQGSFQNLPNPTS